LGFLIEILTIRPTRAKWFGYLLLVLFAAHLHANATEPLLSEYKIKVALLYKLTRFVEWPPATESATPESFNICVLGRDDFGSNLNVLEERKVNGIAIAIRHYSYSTSVESSCQLLFVSDSKAAFMKSILHTFKNQPILTVSDARNFAKDGGIIGLVLGQKHIGFEINLDAAHAAGLKISAPLLELATVIHVHNFKDMP